MSTPSIIDYLRATREAVGLSKCAKCTLLALVSFVDARTGEAWPSVRTLRTATALGKRAIQRAVGELVRAGVVEAINGRAGGVAPGGRGIPTRYRIRLSKLRTMGAPHAPMKGARQDANGRTPVPERAHAKTRMGARHAPEVDIEEAREGGKEAAHSPGDDFWGLTDGDPAASKPEALE